jgi:hypothetical protein
MVGGNRQPARSDSLSTEIIANFKTELNRPAVQIISNSISTKSNANKELDFLCLSSSPLKV